MKAKEAVMYLMMATAAGCAAKSGPDHGNALPLLHCKPNEVVYLKDLDYTTSTSVLSDLECIAGFDLGLTTVDVTGGEANISSSGFSMYNPAHKAALKKALDAADENNDHVADPREAERLLNRVLGEKGYIPESK